ncbi:gliding motility-associated C-terminal domain-containing protein [Flavobacterium gelatinilyticum]|uniref:Ig-like domain-containing protein n=1 Tax=Flavobacterium gelatinilyticum TaxID=3003260 RepID=UPI002480D13A|nr:gliding motility-associated C-terminal domain-containing protein [Flavobacterium gelatinilyticum]
MKKKFTFCDLSKKRLFGLLFLFLLCTNAFSQTICRPLSQTNSQGGLVCLGLDIDSPANAYDSAGLTTYATLTNAVGVGCFVEETLTLNQTARAGDQIAIYFGTGNGLLDLTLLSNVSLQGKLSGANVGSSVALSSPLLNLNLLNGNTVAVARYTVTGDTNQIQVQVGGLVSLLVSLRLYDVRLEFAQPTVSGGLTQTVCAGTQTTLTATAAPGTTLAWYSSAASTTALATGPTFTTPALTASTTYYIGITRQAGCEGNLRVPVVLNVSNPVAPAYSNIGTTVCSTGATQQTTLTLVNPVPGTTYSWYPTASGGASLASGTTYSPTVPLGTTSFFVEASIGTCISPTRTQINVVSTAVPATPTVLTQSVTIQSGQNATLSATTTEPGVQLNWYDTAAGGTPVATNTPNFTTPILTATKTYYVEAQSPNGSCVSAARVPVTVTVQPAALGGCLEASSQQTSQNGLCLLCSSTNPNFSVDGNPATAARLTVPVGLLTGWVQQTLQFINPGKAGDIVDVDLELPGGIADVTLLGGVSLATYNGATYNNDRILATNPLVTLQVLSGNRFRASVVAGANFDRVEIRLGGLATLLSNLDIYQATYRYKAAVITGNTAICSGQTTTLTAALAVGETVNWYSAAAGGPSLASTAAFTTPALTTATTYYAEITRNGCVNSERTPVQITIDNPLAPPVITFSPTTICSGQSTTITIQAPVAGTTYNWYDAATGGNLLFTGTSFTTPALIANTNYYVEGLIGSCPSPTRTLVGLTVSPIPAVPTFASSNVIIQSGQNATLAVSNPTAGVRYNWYDAATGGNIVQPNSPTFTTAILTSTQTYYVEASNISTDCANPARGAVTVTVIASASTCLQANNQNFSGDGVLCVLCAPINPGRAVDGDINSYSQLTVTLGVGAYLQQQLIFANPGVAGDIIDVELEVPGGVLDIGVLSNITLATYNGGIFNNDRRAINNNLLNIQLLSGNKFKASFTAGAAFDRVEVRLGGTASLLDNLYIYQAAYRYPDAVITGAADPICVGGSTILNAVSTGGPEIFTWYDAPTGGNVLQLSTTGTGPLTTSTTYYLQGTRGGCENSLRQAVTVTVLPIPTAADVLITTPIEATCTGGAVIAPSSTIAGAEFRYYTAPNKTGEIVDGTTIGTAVFAKDPITGALTISGLTSIGAPYTYYVSVVNGGTCENIAGTLKEVIVDFPSTTTLTVNAALAACGSANLGNAITNFDSSGNTTYTFYDASNNVITADAAANITVSGVYSIMAQASGDTCPSVRQSVAVTINANPSLVITNPSESVAIGTNVTLLATSTGTITWFDPQGNPLTGPTFTTGVLSTPGVYTYTAVASDGICSTTATKVINVIDLSNCQSLTDRVYATAQTSGTIITGTVTNGASAVDGNPQTFSTITTGIGLLGVGTTWQQLSWAAPITKGTPVTVKLGSEASLLAVGQNLTVIGTIGGVDIGTMQSVSGSLLNLLSGDNTYEFTFVPSDASGPQQYDGIRIQSASLASVAQNTKVFDAYYYTPVTSVTCVPGDIQDVFYGAADLGIGAATATVGVTDAFLVADNDIATYATMFSGVGALAAADLTVQFKTPSVISDTLRIVISKPGALLDVNLLRGFSIQRYLGNVAVGAPIQNTSTLLSLRLLPGNSMAMALVSSPTEIYDRVRIRLGGVAGVLDNLRVHTVERTANTTVIGADPQNKVTVCPGAAITLQIPEEACSTYIWYDAVTGGNALTTGITYTLPANLTAGTYKYYVQPVRYGCETFARGEVTVEVKASAPLAALTDITLNGATDTSICSPTGNVTLATSLSGSSVLTNPVYYWYRLNGASPQLIAGETTFQLVQPGLLPGTYTYYVGVSSDELCETAEADRKQITFTILPPSTINDILVDDATFCHSVPASLTPTAPTLTNPVFTWYLDDARTQPITNGAVISGVTYTINAAGVLTATGLTKAQSPITYYVAVSSDTTCENLAGTLQDAVIMISDPNTPTTTDTTQDFCLIDAPTVASIQVNESGVVWYTVSAGGTALASTTPLVNGTYYGAAVDGVTGCESSVRLAVAISITDPGTPTTTDATQDFCLVDSPTVADIQVNTPATGTIVWYAAATGGTAIPSTTALTNGLYFASILNTTTNCESSVRLQVEVTVSDPGTPTTADTTQAFCLVDAPTVADIQVNTPATGSIVWYSTATGGTAIAPTTALATGNYFASILDPATNCESNVRLQVEVTVSDPGTPTTADTTQDFCLVDAPTVADIQVNTPASGTIVWYAAATGGTAVPATTALATGSYFASILDPITNCESNVRLEVAVTVSDPGTPTTADATQDFCLVNAPTVADIQVNTPATGTIVWYTAVTGGTAIPATTALTNGLYFASILNTTTNCESSVRLQVEVTVSDPGTPTTADTTQAFCLVDAPTVADIQVNTPATGSIVWYSTATGGTAIAPTTALATGNYFASILDPATNCESNVRLQVEVTVSDPGTPTTADTTQDFCLVDAPTVADIQVNTPAAGTIVWYAAATGGTAIPATTALATGSYFASILDPITNCESNVRLEVAVTVSDPGTPTTADATQDFCLVDSPTVADIQVNTPATGTIVWYAAATGGTAIPSTTALTNGLYFASILNTTTNCESSVRLQVEVTVSDPGTPTTADTTQAFCLVDAPTVANIQVNAPATGSIVWYTAATGGTAIPATTALATGNYFASILDPATNCESNVRLQVEVTVSDPGTPTTADTTQDFCLVDAPTVADIQVNTPASGTIVWYTAATGGTAVPATTALATGSYFASILDPVTNCESNVRLEVAVTVSDPGTPTTADATQDFCLVDSPTVADIQVNTPATGTIVWYAAATGGTPLASTATLTNGLYFGSILNTTTNCESSVRLQVEVTVSDPGTPTTADTTQAFCLVDAPTVADIQVNTPATGSIVWYSTATGGTAIAPTTALATGNYFASILDPATNCESNVRLQVEVTVSDPGTPTTADTTQDFCLVDAPTVADIQVNTPASGTIVWYTAATGGTAVPATTALATGSYFASILDPVTNCESNVRLEVAVTVSDPGTPTTADATQDFCLVDSPTVADIQVNTPATGTIVWYAAATGGTPLASTATLTNGLYFGSILNTTTNCESSVRLQVEVTVSDPGTPTTADTTQAFCLVDAPTVADIQVNTPATGSIVWYSTATGGTAIAPTTALATGNYFASILDPATNCESNVRLQVEVTVSDPGTPTTADTTQDFCLVDAPTVADIQVNTPASGTIVWYAAATGGTAIPATTALATGSYFASILDPITNCESNVRLEVAVTVSDPGTPTTADATQDFCLVDSPTVADIQVNAPATGTIVWYTAATGGTAIPSTTALTNGLYFASILNTTTNCESSVRLQVEVTVSDPGTPTTADTTQAFCLVDAPTVANIQVNAPATGSIVWYTAATGGTAIPATTALATGNYFASILDPATNCESSVRLQVEVTVSDPGTPTTADTTQDFCLVDAPTVADIQVNTPASGTIVWYAAATGGTAVPATTALATGSYFASILDPITNCESNVRLEVAVTVSDPGTPTTADATQDFCLVDSPTVADIQVNTPATGTIVWYAAATGGTAIPATTALANGPYYAAIRNAAGCESNARLLVTVTVTNPATPTTNDATQTFCSGTNPTVANIQVNEANVVWYTAATGGTAIPAATALVNGNYYGAIKNPVTGCESNVRLLVAVTVGNTTNPTTANTSQSFCSGSNPTIASIQVNEANVIWFATATGGTAIAPTTALTSGTYYGNIVDPVSGCESTTRLQVIVTVEDPSPTPTTTDTTQDFCSTSNPAVANIQVNQANVIWYSTATGGTPIAPTTALTTRTYYGVIASNTNCENPVRLAVAVSVNTPGVITAPSTTQTFCLSALPTLVNILVNEPNVVWYAAATGGTPLAANTPLTATTYYASALNNTTNGCASAERLGITIAFENDALVQLTTTDDTPCVFQEVTYSIANGKSNYVWSVTNGTIVSGGGTSDGTATISWSDIGAGTIQVTYVNNCNETTTKSLNVTVAACSDLTITNVVDNPAPNFGDHVTFTITVNNVGEGGFKDVLVSELLPSGYQLISAGTSAGTYDQSTQLWTIPTLAAGQSVTLTIVAEVLPSGNYLNVVTIENSTPLDVDQSNNSASASVEPVCLTVYNEFTPNNDGANDLFRIDCIESYPNNELKVFNRYGALVYSKAHYENDWDGTANVSGVVNRGDMLPTGTYFYVITIGDGTVKKGWLSIMR